MSKDTRTSLEKYLDEVNVRVERATKWEWHDWERQSWKDGDFSYELNKDEAFIAIREREYDEHRMQAKFDADFISRSRQDVQNLLAIVKKMHSELLHIATQARDEGDMNLHASHAIIKSQEIAHSGLIATRAANTKE